MDKWFSISGIKKEIKRVRWPKWKTQGNQAGIGKTTGEVLIFTGFFAAFFMLSDMLVALLLRLIGIGA